MAATATAQQLNIKAPAGGFKDLGWYDGYQYNGGTFATQRGVIHPNSPQQGAGQKVSNEVNAQSAAAQGKSTTEFNNYLAGSNSSPAPGGGSVLGASTGVGSVAAGGRGQLVDSLISQFQADEAARQAKSQDARSKLVGYYEGLEDPTARFTRLRDENGLPQQEELVNALTKDVMSNQDIIDGLEEDVTNRSKNFLIDDTGRLSLLGRERAPIEKNLNNLLRNKQYEEIGLQGKQQLVSQLLDLSFKNDQMRAEPFKLGVDFTDKDEEIARQIFQDLADRKTAAFDADQSEAFRSSESAKDRAFSAAMKDQDFQQSKELESIRTSNNIAQYNATTGKKTVAETNKQNAENSAKDVYNKLLGSMGSETQIWQYLMDNRDKFSKLGIMDELWRLHGDFKAKLNSANLKDNSF